MECYLVRGTLDRALHFWNIVRAEDGQYRHVDLSAGLSGLTDEELTAHAAYMWDDQEYPACVLPEPDDPPEELPADENVEEN